MKSQAVRHWSNMLGGFAAPVTTASYLNICEDKQNAVEPSLPAQVATVKAAKIIAPVNEKRTSTLVYAERKRMTEMLHKDMSNRAIYKAMISEGYLKTARGAKVPRETFLSVISKIRKKECKPITGNINSRVNAMVKEGKSYSEIVEKLELNKEQMVNVFSRLRISLMLYKRGKLVKLNQLGKS